MQALPARRRGPPPALPAPRRTARISRLLPQPPSACWRLSPSYTPQWKYSKHVLQGLPPWSQGAAYRDKGGAEDGGT